jgi:hypothetical protein
VGLKEGKIYSMSAIFIAILPMLVTALTSIIKRAPVIDNTNSQGKRNLIIRSIAAILSLGGIVGGFMINGVAPDPAVLADILGVLALAFVTFLGSVGFHSIAKSN